MISCRKEFEAPVQEEFLHGTESCVEETMEGVWRRARKKGEMHLASEGLLMLCASREESSADSLAFCLRLQCKM